MVCQCCVILGVKCTLTTRPTAIRLLVHHVFNGLFQIFVSISPSTLHGHSCVGVNHAGSVVVTTISVLAIVVRFVSVGIVQSNSSTLRLLHHRGVGGVGH